MCWIDRVPIHTSLYGIFLLRGNTSLCLVVDQEVTLNLWRIMFHILSFIFCVFGFMLLYIASSFSFVFFPYYNFFYYYYLWLFITKFDCGLKFIICFLVCGKIRISWLQRSRSPPGISSWLWILYFVSSSLCFIEKIDISFTIWCWFLEIFESLKIF